MYRVHAIITISQTIFLGNEKFHATEINGELVVVCLQYRLREQVEKEQHLKYFLGLPNYQMILVSKCINYHVTLIGALCNCSFM